MTRSYINSFLMSSFSFISWGNFSLNFCPKSQGAFCLLFSRKPVVFAFFCAGHFGADARLGSSATARVTVLTITSRPHIQILCNAQVAFRTVPHDARSCSTCSMICPIRPKIPMILLPSSTPTSQRLSKLPHDSRIATPSWWSRHYASAVFGNGSFLQRDCSNGLLAGLPHASQWVADQNLADPNT